MLEQFFFKICFLFLNFNSCKLSFFFSRSSFLLSFPVEKGPG